MWRAESAVELLKYKGHDDSNDDSMKEIDKRGDFIFQKILSRLQSKTTAETFAVNKNKYVVWLIDVEGTKRIEMESSRWFKTNEDEGTCSVWKKGSDYYVKTRGYAGTIETINRIFENHFTVFEKFFETFFPILMPRYIDAIYRELYRLYFTSRQNPYIFKWETYTLSFSTTDSVIHMEDATTNTKIRVFCSRILTEQNFIEVGNEQVKAIPEKYHLVFESLPKLLKRENFYEFH